MHTRKRKKRHRVNLRALVITVLAVTLVGGGIVGGHYIRKSSIAQRALSSAQAAAAKGDWPEACKHYKTYLDKFPDNTQVLDQYGTALLMQPPNIDIVQAAIVPNARLVRLR